MTPLEIEWNRYYILSGQLYIATMVIPIIAAILFRKHWDRAIRIFFLYCVVTLLINLLEQGFIWATKLENYFHVFEPFLVRWDIWSTSFLSILYHIKNFLLLGWFFSLIFPPAKVKHWILWGGRLLAIAALINYCFIEGFRTPGVFNPTADAIFIVILPLAYLWFSQNQSLRVPLRKNPYFWFSLGLLIPNILGLFLVFAGDYIHQTDTILFSKVNIIKNGFEVLGQILITVGFMRARFVRFIIKEASIDTRLN